MTEVSTVSRRSKARPAAMRAQAYLLGRQSYNAGFCFYKSEHIDEPNLHDTYHAVAALALLSARVPRIDELMAFLDRAKLSAPSDYFYYAFTLDLLGRASRIDAQRLAAIRALSVKVPPNDHRGTASAWLESILRIVRVLRRFARLPELAHVIRYIESLRTDGGYGDGKPNLWDTYLSLSILSILGQDVAEASETAAFVDALQVPSFGFTSTRDSLMGNLDVIHAGVECCALLGLAVRFPSDIMGFVLSCQTARGGFSRAPIALPDIELTHRALRIIARIEGKSAFE